MFEKLHDRVNNWMHPKVEYSNDMLYDLLFGPIDKQPVTEALEIFCGREIANRPAQVAVIRIADSTSISEKLCMIIKSCITVSDSDEVLPVSDSSNQVILLFFPDTLWEDQAREILEDIQKEYIETWPDSRLYITLGAVEDYVEEGEPAWRKSYRTAIGLQDYSYVKPKGKVISYSDIIARRHIYPKGICFRFDYLKECLENDNKDLLHGWLSGIYSMVSGEGMDTFGLCYHLTLEIIINVVSLFREKGLSPEAYIGPPEVLIEEVLCIETPQGMQQWTELFLENCHKILQQ